MKKKIVKMGNEVLYKKARKVIDVNEEEVKDVIIDLRDTFDESNEFTVGISAPQIGYDLAVCLCRDVNTNATYIMINPEITSKSKEVESHVEGCKSIGTGEDGAGTILGRVERAKEVTIRYLDEKGKSKTLTAEGFFAAVLQHEIDHLNGRLYIYYITDPEKLEKRGEDATE
ncbi:MAG: peptide deformylase, partial [Candidatus Dojkabacteria bacterium]|nr:peptide deformylase [Candidatus Dojkabacteria bacterium]